MDAKNNGVVGQPPPRPQRPQSNRARNRYPLAALYRSLIAAVSKFEADPDMPWECVPCEFPHHAIPVREAIKAIYAARHGGYFSLAEFTLSELAAGKPLNRADGADPACHLRWQENILLDNPEFFYTANTPAALVVHPYSGPGLRQAYEDTAPVLLRLGLGFAEAGKLLSWQWPFFTGMMVVVPLGAARFKPVVSLQQLLDYLDRQQRLTPMPARLLHYRQSFSE